MSLSSLRPPPPENCHLLTAVLADHRGQFPGEGGAGMQQLNIAASLPFEEKRTSVDLHEWEAEPPHSRICFDHQPRSKQPRPPAASHARWSGCHPPPPGHRTHLPTAPSQLPVAGNCSCFSLAIDRATHFFSRTPLGGSSQHSQLASDPGGRAEIKFRSPAKQAAKLQKWVKNGQKWPFFGIFWLFHLKILAKKVQP